MIRLILIVSIVVGMLYSADEKLEISGDIVNGLRVVDYESIESGNLTFYRGDYLVINHEHSDTITLKIDELKISKQYPAPVKEKSYVKLKSVGAFQYSFGEVKGTINIVEYTQAQYKAINAAEANEVIKNLDPVILDVRTQFEFDRGYLKNTQLIPLQVLQKEYIKLSEHKDKPILIYCASGNRSTVAARILIDHGFKNIFNMRYGINEWQRNGFEVLK